MLTLSEHPNYYLYSVHMCKYKRQPEEVDTEL